MRTVPLCCSPAIRSSESKRRTRPSSWPSSSITDWLRSMESCNERTRIRSVVSDARRIVPDAAARMRLTRVVPALSPRAGLKGRLLYDVLLRSASSDVEYRMGGRRRCRVLCDARSAPRQPRRFLEHRDRVGGKNETHVHGSFARQPRRKPVRSTRRCCPKSFEAWTVGDHQHDGYAGDACSDPAADAHAMHHGEGC